MPAAGRTVPDAPVFDRTTLRGHGWTDPSISRATRAGRLHVVRRGLFSAAPPTAALRARAATRACGGSVASHLSALVLHGLPLVGVAGRLPEVTVLPTGTGDASATLLHRATLRSGDVTSVDGCPVTTVARTLVDVARSRPTATSVSAIDAALHRRLVTSDELDEVVLRCWNWPGIRRAHRALRLADGRAESPLESVSRLAIGWLRLPRPEPQVCVVDGRGIVIARLDFYWDEFGVAGEADGRSKYTDRDVLNDEKDRQEDVEDLGLAFARWRWWHTTHPHALRTKIRHAFERGRARDRSGLPRNWSVRPT